MPSERPDILPPATIERTERLLRIADHLEIGGPVAMTGRDRTTVRLLVVLLALALVLSVLLLAF